MEEDDGIRICLAATVEIVMADSLGSIYWASGSEGGEGCSGAWNVPLHGERERERKSVNVSDVWINPDRTKYKTQWRMLDVNMLYHMNMLYKTS
jgi:hypothetical protein